MNFHNFISNKLFSSEKNKRSISRPIVKIAISGIALGIMVMILSLSIVTGFQREIKNKVIGVSSHISVLKFDTNTSSEPQPISKNQAFLSDVKGMPNVQHTQVFAVKNGIIKTKNENEGVILKGVSDDYNWTFLGKHLVEGRLPEIKQKNISNELFISHHLSKKLRLKTNDRVVVYFITRQKQSDSTRDVGYEQRVRSFKICGVFDTGFEDLDAQMAFVDLKHIQKLNYWSENEVGGFEIQLKDFNLIEQSCNQINEALGYELKAQHIKEAYPGIFGWLDLMDSNAVIIISLMLVVAAINMISALLILMLEKTSSIGLLKALGAGNSDIRKIFLNLSFKLITKGLIIGNVLGISLSLLQLKYKFLTLNQETYYLSYVPVNFNLWHIFFLNLGTLLTCTLFMLLPTMIINKISPVKAIRFN